MNIEYIQNKKLNICIRIYDIRLLLFKYIRVTLAEQQKLCTKIVKRCEQ